MAVQVRGGWRAVGPEGSPWEELCIYFILTGMSIGGVVREYWDEHWWCGKGVLGAWGLPMAGCTRRKKV